MGKTILFIGDLHGNSNWKDIANEALLKFYHIVFLGDYFDSRINSPIEQLRNIKELIKFAKKHKNNVTLLLGNHDYSYLIDNFATSGFQSSHMHDFKKILQDNSKLFKIAWGYTNTATGKYTLATHAGLTTKFWIKHILPEIKEGGFVHSIVGNNDIPIHEVLNYLKDKTIIFKVGNARGGSGEPGVLWADLSEMIQDRLQGINQVFGHTSQIAVRLNMYDDEFIACVDTSERMGISSLVLTL